MGDRSNIVNRFRSALGAEDLTAIVLQYAMYAREAKRVLTTEYSPLGTDPPLAHLYHNHAGRFVPDPYGVEVTGAGDAQINGWYTRKDVAEGPPRKWYGPGMTEWGHTRCGFATRYWYLKHDGYFIWRGCDGDWILCDPEDSWCYKTQIFCNGWHRDHPPAQGWRACAKGRNPAPILRVVS